MNPESNTLPAARPPDLGAALRGDRGAQGSLLDRLRPYLRAIASRDGRNLGKSRTEIDDLVQDTIVKALRSISQFHGTTEEEFRGWLRQILLNRQRDAERHWQRDRREAGREVSVDQVDGHLKDQLTAKTASPMAELIRRERIETIRTALELLRPDHFDVIMLHCREDLTFDEAGLRLGRSGEAARKMWERALAQLKLHLQEMSEEDSDFQDRR